MAIKRLILTTTVLLLLASVFSSYGQTIETRTKTTDNVVFYFRFDKSMLDSGYMDNSKSLAELEMIMTNRTIMSNMDSVVIVASASPDGVFEHNTALARRRAIAVKGYIIGKYPYLNQSKIYTRSIGEDWDGLKKLVEADNNIPYRDEVLKILEQDVSNGTKERRLKQIGGGKSYEYIVKNMLRYLRSGATTMIFYYKEIKEESAPIKEEHVAIEDDSIKAENRPQTEPIQVQQNIVSVVDDVNVKMVPGTTMTKGVIRTNALFDAGLMPNVGIEVTLAKKLTIGADFYIGWTNLKTYRTHGQNVILEVRYYFVESFKGHHLGLFGDYYNIKNVITPALKYIGYSKDGYAWGVGLLYGYTFNLGGRFSLDLNIGGEYVKIDAIPMILVRGEYKPQMRVTKDAFIPRAGVTFGWKIF